MAYKRQHKTAPIWPWQRFRLGFLKAPDAVMCPKPECFARFPDFNVGLRASLHGPHLKCSTLQTFWVFLLTSFIFILKENDLNETSVFAFPLVSQSAVAVELVLLPICSHFRVFNVHQYVYLVLADK